MAILAVMKLKDWLKREGMTGAAFAERIGVKQGTISRYTMGVRTPDMRIIEKIHIETNGEVSAPDFMFCGQAESAEVAA
jgi:transcriptional regulator with XRE-family HTH domain